MRVLATEEEKEILRKYMVNIDDYLDKELTEEEYLNFELDLNDEIISLFDENQEATKESVMLQKIYDNIYYRD